MKLSLPSKFIVPAFALACLSFEYGHTALIAEQEYNTVTPSATFGFNGGSGTPPPYNFLDVGTSQAGLTYSTLSVTGASRAFSNIQGGFSGGPISNNGTYFISFLYNAATNQNGRVGLTLMANFVQDGNGNGTGTEVAEIGQNLGFFNILTGNYGSGTAFQNMSTGIATNGNTHLVVIGVNTNSTNNTSSISFYLDPITSIAPSPTLVYSAGLPAFHLNNIRAFGSATWDEFRVGSTFADVTPGLPVPEPSTALLSSLGLGFVLRRRRKPQA